MNTIKKIIFFNHWHNGDIHYSRAFCHDIMNQLGSTYEYYYAHKQKSYIVEDVCKHLWPVELPDMHSFYEYRDNTLFINTWVGQNNTYYYKSVGYIGLETMYRIFTDMYSILNQKFNLNLKISSDPDFYIPEIFFNKLINYKSQNPEDIYGKKPILVCNNFCNSNQAYNYDITPIIEELSKHFSDEIFLVTNKINNFTFSQPNVHYVDSLNLNEIGFYGTHSKIIIGRGSGPFCFADHKQTILNPKITFIGLGNPDHGGEKSKLHIFWGRLPQGKCYFSMSSDLNEVSNTIFTGIKEHIEQENC
jgi:hypothetical protein